MSALKYISYDEYGYKVTESGQNIAIIALGDFYQIGEKSAKLIADKTGVTPTLINPRYITGIDAELL